MLRLKQPSLVVNSCDVPPPTYSMRYTLDAPEGFTVAELVQQILISARRASRWGNKSLVNVILNCHSAPGPILRIGGMDLEGLALGDESMFTPLKPLNLGAIWLVSCDAARETSGTILCTALAKAAGCSVIASSESQHMSMADWAERVAFHFFYQNCIDEFEGDVYRYSPSGAEIRIDPHQDVWTTTLIE